MKKSSIILSLILLILLFVYIVTSNQGVQKLNAKAQEIQSEYNSISGIDSIQTTNYANTTLEYYYYIPKKIAKNSSAPFLIMVPGLSGKGQDFVTQVFKDFAQKEGFVIIAPSFMEDRNNWESNTSYQYPQAWSGQAFNAILNSFIAKHDIHVSTLYMFGFSAGAQFVSRYSMLYPDYVTACAFNAPGGTDDPVKYQGTKFYVGIGSYDEDSRKKTVGYFRHFAKKVNLDVTYKEYDVGHSLSYEEIIDELAFFSQIKNGQR